MQLQEFAHALLTEGGFVDNDEHVLGIVAWAVAENSEARFNPLDTTQPEDGAEPFNTIPIQGGEIHVWNYPDAPTGIKATLATLGNGHYSEVLTELRTSPGSADALARAVGTTPWGTGDFSAVVAQVRAAPDQYLSRLVAGSDPAPEAMPPASSPGEATASEPPSITGTTDSDRGGLVRLTYLGVGRAEPTPEELAAGRWAIATEGLDAYVQAIADSPAGQAAREKGGEVEL